MGMIFDSEFSAIYGFLVRIDVEDSIKDIVAAVTTTAALNIDNTRLYIMFVKPLMISGYRASWGSQWYQVARL